MSFSRAMSVQCGQGEELRLAFALGSRRLMGVSQMGQWAQAMPATGRIQSFLIVRDDCQEREEAPGWPGWDGMEQAMAKPARAAGRTRKLGSRTSTFTARGMEDIVRERHLHREILAHASALELKCQFDRVARRAASLSMGSQSCACSMRARSLPGIGPLEAHETSDSSFAI